MSEIPTRTMVCRSTSISPERILNSPTKVRIRETHTSEMKSLKRKLHLQNYNQKKLHTKLKSLKAVLKDLQKRNLITSDESDILQHSDEGVKELMKREIRKRKQLPVSRIYKDSLRQFALSLHYYSPKAYDYVRHKFYNSLPHPKTLSKWYHSFDGEPGINTEALEAIKLRVRSVPYKLIGALIFDEMAIRQHVDYCKDKFVGYVDFGEHVECDTTKIAREALVFYVVCINQSWKIPIAYYLVNGISTEQKLNLTLQCLLALQQTGMLIVSLTCDGLRSNLNMLQKLGCNFDTTNNFQTYFKHPANDTNVYVFLDPSHMLKLVRNSLGSTKQLLDGNGNKIEWKYFEELHKLQEAEGLHLANKLRTKHIEYFKNKMKVKLATQLLSMSIANAFQICKDILKLPQFQNCSATIRFTSMFNELFDIFNSKNQRKYGFKRPLSINNYLEISDKVKECTEYIKSLSLVQQH